MKLSHQRIEVNGWGHWRPEVSVGAGHSAPVYQTCSVNCTKRYTESLVSSWRLHKPYFHADDVVRPASAKTDPLLNRHRWLLLLWFLQLLTLMNKRSERRKHCALAVIRRTQKFSPCRRPLPGGAGWPKFNQLEMVTTFTYRPSLVKIDICNFELSW